MIIEMLRLLYLNALEIQASRIIVSYKKKRKKDFKNDYYQKLTYLLSGLNA